MPGRAFDVLGVDSLRALNTPFLITSQAALQAVLDSDLRDDLLAGLPEAGLVGSRPVPRRAAPPVRLRPSPARCRRLRRRTPSGPARRTRSARLFAALGATTTTTTSDSPTRRRRRVAVLHSRRGHESRRATSPSSRRPTCWSSGRPWCAAVCATTSGPCCRRPQPPRAPGCSRETRPIGREAATRSAGTTAARSSPRPPTNCPAWRQAVAPVVDEAATGPRRPGA